MKKKNRILIATHNEGKLEEFKTYLSPFFENIISLKTLNDFDEVIEDQDSYEGNAIKKAMYYYQKYNMPTLADDSGLEVLALGGYPGIHSARIGHNDQLRNQMIIEKLHDFQNRKACMKTVIAYVDIQTHIYHGEMCGIITKQPIGDQGFGYDSIFFIDSLNQTFGELSRQQKLTYSHRGKALKQFIESL